MHVLRGMLDSGTYKASHAAFISAPYTYLMPKDGLTLATAGAQGVHVCTLGTQR